MIRTYAKDWISQQIELIVNISINETFHNGRGETFHNGRGETFHNGRGETFHNGRDNLAPTLGMLHHLCIG